MIISLNMHWIILTAWCMGSPKVYMYKWSVGIMGYDWIGWVGWSGLGWCSFCCAPLSPQVLDCFGWQSGLCHWVVSSSSTPDSSTPSSSTIFALQLLIAGHKQFRGVLGGQSPPILAFSLRVLGLVSREYDVLVCRWIASRPNGSQWIGYKACHCGAALMRKLWVLSALAR